MTGFPVGEEGRPTARLIANPMIAATGEPPRPGSVALPWMRKPSRVGVIAAPIPAQFLGHRRDAIHLLHAELRRAADHRLAVGQRRRDRQRRHLVDQPRNQVRPDRNAP